MRNGEKGENKNEQNKVSNYCSNKNEQNKVSNYCSNKSEQNTSVI